MSDAPLWTAHDKGTDPPSHHAGRLRHFIRRTALPGKFINSTEEKEGREESGGGGGESKLGNFTAAL